MIIDVRPTPALRRHRPRLVGALVGAALGAVTVVSVGHVAGAVDKGHGETSVMIHQEPPTAASR